MEQEDRTRAVAEFMQDEECHVLLASIRAASAGINLTRATRIVFMYGQLRFFWNYHHAFVTTSAGIAAGAQMWRIKSVEITL
jgi:hypothetical protein